MDRELKEDFFGIDDRELEKPYNAFYTERKKDDKPEDTGGKKDAVK